MNQAEINSRMSRWGDGQISRYLKRAAMFRRRGANEHAAEFTADRLAMRDQEGDDRRMCIECSSFQRSQTCFKRLPFDTERLIRCHGFEWQLP